MSTINDIIAVTGITFTYGFIYCNQEALTKRYEIGCSYKYPQETLKKLNSKGMTIDLQFQFAIYIKDYIRIERLIRNILEGQDYTSEKYDKLFNISINKIFYLFNKFNNDGFDLIYYSSYYLVQNNQNNQTNQNNQNNQNNIIHIKHKNNNNVKIETNIIQNKKRKYRKLNHFLNSNTKIRHIIKFDKYNDIWEGIYYFKTDIIICDNIKFNSLTRFTNSHYKKSNSKRNTCNNPWKEIEYLYKNNWYIVDKLN